MKTPVQQIEFMRNLLAFALIASFVGALIAFTFIQIPEANKDIITYMVGQLSGMALMALGFYYVNKVGQDALDAQRSENTSKAFDAVVATATGVAPTATVDAAEAADTVAQAAVEEAEAIRGENR